MNTLKCPAAAEVLLHCHYSVEPLRDAPAVNRAVTSLCDSGMLEPRLGFTAYCFTTTARGRAHVEAICRMPFPVRGGYTDALGNQYDDEGKPTP